MGSRMEQLKKKRRERDKLCEEATYVKKQFEEKNATKTDVVNIHKQLVEVLNQYDPYWVAWNKFMKAEIWK